QHRATFCVLLLYAFLQRPGIVLQRAFGKNRAQLGHSAFTVTTIKQRRSLCQLLLALPVSLHPVHTLLGAWIIGFYGKHPLIVACRFVERSIHPFRFRFYETLVHRQLALLE